MKTKKETRGGKRAGAGRKIISSTYETLKGPRKRSFLLPSGFAKQNS